MTFKGVSSLNYIKEINAFYDWLEINSISDSAIALWHALMHINNKAGWIPEFTVAISTLETKTGLKKGAIIRARNRLQQVGRIDFRSRNGQLSAIYKIIPFEFQNGTQSETQTETQTDANIDCVPKKNTNWNANRYTNRTQSETQTGPINKLNETKLNETSVVDDNYQPTTDNDKPYMAPSTDLEPCEVVLNYYCQKAGIIETKVGVKELESIKSLIDSNIPVELIKNGIDAAFKNYRPQYDGDKINSFNYCVPVIKALISKSKLKGRDSRGNNSCNNTKADGRSKKVVYDFSAYGG